MNHHPITDSQRIRMAVAVVVLIHKPRDRSLHTHMLELRSRFKSEKDSDSDPWRERALALEEQVKYLNSKVGADSIEHTLLIRGVEAERDNENTALSSFVSQIDSMKSALLRCNDIPYCTFRPDAQEGLPCTWINKGCVSSPLYGVAEVLASYRKLLILAGTHDSGTILPDHMDSLLNASTDVIQGLGVMLHSLLKNLHPNATDSINVVDFFLTSVLSYVLSSSFVGNSCDHTSHRRVDQCFLLDRFVGSVVTDIVLPIIKSITRLSLEVSKPLFSQSTLSRMMTSDPSDANDICASLLGIVLRVLSRLKDGPCPSSTQASCCCIAASAMFEISRLWPIASSVNIPANHTSELGFGASPHHRLDRINRLAQKDTIWYLCSIVHATLPPTISQIVMPSRRHDSNIDEMIQDEIKAILSDLLVRCFSSIEGGGVLYGDLKTLITEVEMGLLFTIVEKTCFSDLGIM